jgi:hypothetical protein
MWWNEVEWPNRDCKIFVTVGFMIGAVVGVAVAVLWFSAEGWPSCVGDRIEFEHIVGLVACVGGVAGYVAYRFFEGRGEGLEELEDEEESDV